MNALKQCFRLLLHHSIQSCLTLCYPMDYSMPGFPVLHRLLELAQTHVHQVSDAIQPSHPLSLSPPAFSLSQLQGLIQWVSILDQVAKLLEFQLQHQSFQWIFRTDFLSGWQVGSPWSPRDFQESSLAPQFKSINSSMLSFQKYIYIYKETLTFIPDYWKNHSLTTWTFFSKVMPLLFNTLSRLVIAFLQRSKCLLI